MPQEIGCLYDLFISSAPSDTKWVDTWLLPPLKASGLRVALDPDDFIAGMPRVENIERCIKLSHRTLVILTPAWVQSDWNALVGLIVNGLDPAARKRKLIPVLLQPCTDLPQYIEILSKIDFTQPDRQTKALQKLIRDIKDVIPMPPIIQIGLVKYLELWLRRYRRMLLQGGMLGLLLLTLLFATLGWWPLQSRQGWQVLNSPQVSGQTHLIRLGTTLFITTNTDSYSPDDTGLWRSDDNGSTWEAVVNVPLKIPGNTTLAEIHDLAFSPSKPKRIFAVTSHVGLLRSDTGGTTWQSVHSALLPEALQHVGVSPVDADLIFVIATGEGVYRSEDGGQSWEQLDKPTRCPTGATVMALPSPFIGDALLVTKRAIYLGTGLRADGYAAPNAGLYVSYDRGNCWQRIHDGSNAYSYIALAQSSGTDDQLLVLAYHVTTSDKEPGVVWSLHVGDLQPQLLWSTRWSLAKRLLVSGNPQSQWYIATDVGFIYAGDLTGQHKQRLPWLTHAFFANIDLAFDHDGQTPLLLVRDHLYRLQEVPVYRLLWP